MHVNHFTTTIIPHLLLATLFLTLQACGGGEESAGSGSASSSDDSEDTPTVNEGDNALKVIAWNDLGMHCVDGNDYSIFSILPPYNTVNAQAVKDGELVTQGIQLTYEAVEDLGGSINTTSSNKTNFWDHVEALYGANLAPDIGLTGLPMASTTPETMHFDTSNQWFSAEGIPITHIDDAFAVNPYPMVKITARDDQGNELASTRVVTPVSDEMNCRSCHQSTTDASALATAAQPSGGWIMDPDLERDWKLNILALHDDLEQTNALYQSALTTLGLNSNGLLASVEHDQRPVLCAACHASNALPGTGISGISPLTQAIHSRHADVLDPTTNPVITLNDSTNRDSCYLCHPGKDTQCLRGAMGKAVDTQGHAVMTCQSCHGTISQVGDGARVGWLEQPNCQSCHHDGLRETVGVDAAGKPLVWNDARFATNSDTPAAGFDLYRFSTGHGGLQCEACHGSTHAVFPSAEANDNVQSVDLQGYAGTLTECTTCHADIPRTDDGGPHGMHAISQWWVDEHGDFAEQDDAASCSYCHGANYRGSFLSEVKTARKFDADEFGTASYTAGDMVGCYDCHDGPEGD